MKYFYRGDSNAPKKYKQEDRRVLTRKNCMEAIFQFGYVNFQLYITSILFNRDSIRSLQKYLLTDPEHLNKVIDYLNRPVSSMIFPFQLFSDWNEIALKWNLPDRFFVRSENHVVSAIKSFVFGMITMFQEVFILICMKESMLSLIIICPKTRKNLISY